MNPNTRMPVLDPPAPSKPSAPAVPPDAAPPPPDAQVSVLKAQVADLQARLDHMAEWASMRLGAKGAEIARLRALVQVLSPGAALWEWWELYIGNAVITWELSADERRHIVREVGVNPDLAPVDPKSLRDAVREAMVKWPVPGPADSQKGEGDHG